MLAALAEIEAGGDEQMQREDSIEPPNVAPGAKIPASAGLDAEAGTAAPAVQVPTRSPERRKKTQGFRAVDVIIALVALVVIGLSVLGLTWLFRSN